MHKQTALEERSHFGQYLIVRGPCLEKSSHITTFWKSESSPLEASAISIHLVITSAKELSEAKITNNNLKVTMKFDSSGNLVVGSYPAEYEKLARSYEKSFKSLIARLGIKTAAPSPQEVFKPLAAIGESAAKQKIAETMEKSGFSRVVGIQEGPNRAHVTIPREMVKKHDLEDGRIAYWKILGGDLILNIIKGTHENVTQVWEKDYRRLGISIPVRIQREADQKGIALKPGMSFKFEKITRDDGKFLILKPTEQDPDAKVYGANALILPSKSKVQDFIMEDTLLDWRIEENKILLKLLGIHKYPVKIYEQAPDSLAVSIPKSLMEELGLQSCKKAEWMDGKQIILMPILLPAEVNK